jgi:hypothetical protein
MHRRAALAPELREQAAFGTCHGASAAKLELEPTEACIPPSGDGAVCRETRVGFRREVPDGGMHMMAGRIRAAAGADLDSRGDAEAEEK